ncbi:MAG: endo-1,4-beta-xylanase [Halorhabdus sp.]
MSRTLRDVADDQNVSIGAAAAADPIRQDFQYRDALREFNAVTPENAMKMGPLRPDEYTFDFADADLIADFAREHDMYLRGHTLVWHNQLPEWLIPFQYTDRQLRRLLQEHVRTVAGRYAGTVDTWDVINEAVADDGGLRETPWLGAFGETYLDSAFEWTDQVAPDADLFYNDYGADGINDKSDEIYALLDGMLDRGVPIDGVGLQMHALHDPVDPESVAENVARFKDLGLDVEITEMDVAYTAADPPEDHQELQAEYYREIVEQAMDAGCDTFVVWGVADHHSWIPHFDETLTEDPLLLDDGYDRKPAYDAIVDLLS